MRTFFLFSIGLSAVACGLSMNPDLPSNREEDTGGVGATSGDGDIDWTPPDVGAPSEGAAGAACTGPGGAGGGDGEPGETEPSGSDPMPHCEGSL